MRNEEWYIYNNDWRCDKFQYCIVNKKSYFLIFLGDIVLEQLLIAVVSRADTTFWNLVDKSKTHNIQIDDDENITYDAKTIMKSEYDQCCKSKGMINFSNFGW